MSKTFYIIDGHAQIYRAYFAPFRDLKSNDGEPTKATFVFTQMLINLVQQRKPDYLAMVIDSGDEHVFRKEIFPEYKANRQSPPEDFAPQEKRILQIVRDAGVPIFCKPGFEADDLIATMADKLQGQGYEIVIVSKDKDLRQILDEHTRLYDVQSDSFTNVAKMQADCGYGPAEAVEVQTLTGDTIDNVPGIPGVGDKTAAKLIKQYGSADAVLEHLDELTPKLRENFEKFRDRLPMARKLVTLKHDVEFDFDPAACQFNSLNAEAIKPHLQLLGFTSLMKKLGIEDGAPPRPPTPPPKRSGPVEIGLFGAMGGESDAVESRESGDSPAQESPPQTYSTGQGLDYQLVDTEEKFAAFIDKLKQQKRFAFDTETDALGAMRSNLIGMSFSWQAGTGFYIPVKGPSGSAHLETGRVLREIKPILEDESVKKVGHNLKYDLLVMRVVGVELRGIELDSMVAAFLIDPTRMQYGIDRLAIDLLNFKKVATSELIGKGKTQFSMDRVDLQRVAEYASEDADIALRLADLMQVKLAEIPTIQKLAMELEIPLVPVMAEMEFNGIAIDLKILKEQNEVIGRRIEELRDEIYTAAGGEFNLDSPKQLGDVLFDRLKLRVIKKTKTGRSTDVEVLEKLAGEHPVAKLMLSYRTLTKLKNTYLDNLPEHVNTKTGRIHPSFSQIGAETGRLSCNDPNLQNIPIRTDEGRRIRLAFVPGDPVKNVLLTADYSQIELRILAHYTQEPALLKAFEADEDIHQAVAAEVFNVPLDQVSKSQRGQAKTVNFGIIYGVSAFGLARRIEGLTVMAAQDLIIAYNRRFPSIAKFLEQCVMNAQAHGYVETILGRRRPITEINSAVLAIRNGAERMAINSVVQGSAADLIKVAMLNIYRRLKRENRPSRLLLQVHDELVFETPADQVETEAAMVREEMTGAMKLIVPLKVEVNWAKNWQEVK